MKYSTSLYRESLMGFFSMSNKQVLRGRALILPSTLLSNKYMYMIHVYDKLIKWNVFYFRRKKTHQKCRVKTKMCNYDDD
uniref:Uncharacterized protein n=1 Tax=Lepeophtheirus salmonis TaxID=72036 RepID=A0A0K2UWR3_LEPSM